MTRHERRSRMGMVLQHTWLFGGTIRDNIAYGRPEASEAEILEAAPATYVAGLFDRCPRGTTRFWTTRVPMCRRGEKQLLTIARAFLSRRLSAIRDAALILVMESG